MGKKPGLPMSLTARSTPPLALQTSSPLTTVPKHYATNTVHNVGRLEVGARSAEDVWKRLNNLRCGDSSGFIVSGFRI